MIPLILFWSLIVLPSWLSAFTPPQHARRHVSCSPIRGMSLHETVSEDADTITTANDDTTTTYYSPNRPLTEGRLTKDINEIDVTALRDRPEQREQLLAQALEKVKLIHKNKQTPVIYTSRQELGNWGKVESHCFSFQGKVYENLILDLPNNSQKPPILIGAPCSRI